MQVLLTLNCDWWVFLKEFSASPDWPNLFGTDWLKYLRELKSDKQPSLCNISAKLNNTLPNNKCTKIQSMPILTFLFTNSTDLFSAACLLGLFKVYMT